MIQALLHDASSGGPDLLRSVLAFFVVLGVLVFVHEFGHYLAARCCGVQVEVFSIGFGRALATWRDAAGTRWTLGWLPLGGYVRLHGQETPEMVSEEIKDGWVAGRTFHDKPVLARMLVVLAGPVANLIFAVFLLAGLFATAGLAVAGPQVGEVLSGSPAQTAGLEPGDQIETIGGQTITRFADIQSIVAAHPGAVLPFCILRGKQSRTLRITLESRIKAGHRIGLLGISGANMVFQRLGPVQAVETAFQQTGQIIAQTLAGLWRMITAREGIADLGGPLRIAQFSGEAAQMGFANLAAFLAMLSINLGLINLFPIPLLDGGHVLFYLVELLSGRAVSARMQDYAQRLGFIVLGGIFLFATWNDLLRLPGVLQGGHWLNSVLERPWTRL